MKVGKDPTSQKKPELCFRVKCKAVIRKTAEYRPDVPQKFFKKSNKKKKILDTNLLTVFLFLDLFNMFDLIRNSSFTYIARIEFDVSKERLTIVGLHKTKKG